MKITIIGAGIGGLTTAIALKQKGFEVEIFEATPTFTKAGSGINLAINAMQVFKKLGLYDLVLKAGSYTSSMHITDEKLKPLSVINLKPFEELHHVKSVAIHRATLHQILLDQLTNVPLHLNKKVKNIEQVENKIDIYFEDGTTHETRILIAADGIHSVIRKLLFEDTEIRNANQICWRGITKIELPKKYHSELNEPWGKGKRFGFVAIADDTYYWYALANGYNDALKKYKIAELMDLYSDFNPIIGKIIRSTPPENMLTNEILDLKPIRTWYQNNICLVGDSAHATTPNLGQGACQAIESALVLANCLSEYPNPQDAFKVYQEIRLKKANDVVNTSWKIGKLAQLENNFLIKLRNLILRMTPQKIATKQLNEILKINNVLENPVQK